MKAIIEKVFNFDALTCATFALIALCAFAQAVHLVIKALL
jgi:hypothetical protein